MERHRGARPRAAVLLAGTALLAMLGGTGAWEDGVMLPTEALASGATIANTDTEQAVVQQIWNGMLEVALDINDPGREDTRMVQAMEVPPQLNNSTMNASAIQAQLFASAIATWQLGVWDAPSNRGLRPTKLDYFDLIHYYQVPKDPVGTLVAFHGCNHDASGGWPYDPVHCPECLGLPEEVAITKLALKHGLAVLAVESRNRSRNGRCFSSSPDYAVSDQWTAPYAIQEFLYTTNLQGKPIYTIGISAGAAFATKVIKNFWAEQFGGVIKPAGIISEVNAPTSWRSWGLEGLDGKLKYPDFPPVCFVAMERDTSTNQLIMARIADLRRFGVPADYVMIKPSKVSPTWFSNRSPVVTARQSAEIVAAMKALGFLDAQGNLKYDPRIGQQTPNNPLTLWNQKLVQKLPWLHNNPKLPPMLSVLSDRSTIFEEMNAAWSFHEGVADPIVPCLVWMRTKGRANLKQLYNKMRVTKLADVTMQRVYWKPPPPFPPRPPHPQPPPRPPPRPRPPHPRPPRPRPPPHRRPAPRRNGLVG